MGVMGGKGPTKPRPAMSAQRPLSPRAVSGTAPTATVKTTAATLAPPISSKEEEKLRGTSVRSPVNTTIITNKITTNTNRTKVVVAASEVKKDKQNEEKSDQSEKENSLIHALGDMSLNEDNDLNKKINNLSIKDKQQEKENSEESDLLSRGPNRVCTKGNSRTTPYLYEQHIVSSDRYGGGTVLYPNISPPHKVINYPHVVNQEFCAANCQYSSEDSGFFTNGNQINDLNSEQENSMLGFSEELPILSDDDLKLLKLMAETLCQANFTDLGISDIDKIIESKEDDKNIQPIKRELWEGVTDRKLAPTSPGDSAYDSDECSVGSPSSVTSVVVRTDTDKVVTISAPPTPVVAQPTNLHPQSGFAPGPISPVIQTVMPAMLLLCQQQPKTLMPPLILPQPQQQPRPQPVVSPATPPLSPQVPRPILPGINIPAACNRCSEPAINRIRSVMVDKKMDAAFASILADPETTFTNEDEDGNMILSRVLSNSHKIKCFMEVLYALIYRLKEIINKNKQMACKLLATPNKNGHTPLDIACRFLRSNPQNALAVRYLADTMVEEGLAIGKEVDSNGNSLLHKICVCGDEACFIMAELLSMKDQQGKSVFDVNQKNNEGKTPLHIAAQTHSDRTSCAVLAQLLLRSGADVSEKEGCAGNTVFHLVARESCDPSLIVMLLAKTSNASKVINEKNFNEDTPLHMVAANHAIPPTRQRLAVQHLIAYGADPKLQNKSRKAPLSLVPTDRKQDIKNVLYHKRQVICQE